MLPEASNALNDEFLNDNGCDKTSHRKSSFFKLLRVYSQGIEQWQPATGPDRMGLDGSEAMIFSKLNYRITTF